MIITQFLCQKKERHFYTSLSKSGINGTKKRSKKGRFIMFVYIIKVDQFLTKYGTIWIYSYQKNYWQTKKYCRIDISDQMILALHQGQKKTICYPFNTIHSPLCLNIIPCPRFCCTINHHIPLYDVYTLTYMYISK